jgi:hypothetical protein
LIKHDWSDSSNSGFHWLCVRRGLSSADTVVSPAEDGGRISPRKEGKAEYDDDEWPVTYLTTFTRQELEEYEKNISKTQQRRRRFTWGRKEGHKFLDDKGTSETEMEVGKRTS